MENEKIYHILVINPGSTSTKVALFENDNCVLSRSVFHDSSELLKYNTINDQLNYRMHVMRQFLKDSNVDLNNIDAVVGRGGPCYACESGCYTINEQLVKDTHDCRGHFYHSSMLGVQMAYEFQHRYGGIALMVDPPVVDELCDEARFGRRCHPLPAAGQPGQVHGFRLHADEGRHGLVTGTGTTL